MLSLDEQCKRDRGTNACFVSISHICRPLRFNPIKQLLISNHLSVLPNCLKLRHAKHNNNNINNNCNHYRKMLASAPNSFALIAHPAIVSPTGQQQKVHRAVKDR